MTVKTPKISAPLTVLSCLPDADVPAANDVAQKGVVHVVVNAHTLKGSSLGFGCEGTQC